MYSALRLNMRSLLKKTLKSLQNSMQEQESDTMIRICKSKCELLKRPRGFKQSRSFPRPIATSQGHVQSRVFAVVVFAVVDFRIHMLRERKFEDASL